MGTIIEMISKSIVNECISMYKTAYAIFSTDEHTYTDMKK